MGKISEHVKDANGYIKDVLSGNIPACKWVQLACERQRDDLKRWKKSDKRSPFYFDEVAADRICWFTENLYHVKGEWAKRRETIKLQPWQKFILTTAFGWKRPDGLRRFRTSYNEIPRKNAKSTLSSGVGLYMLVEDEEAGAEVYSAATTRDQAKIVWNDAKAMVNKDKELQSHRNVEAMAHSIVSMVSGSKFQALSADANSLDGLNIHCALVDELHAHKTREVWDVLETATGSRSQPMIWAITTAGSNRAGICYEVRNYLTKVLQRIVEDETFFGCIWTIDDEDNWTEPESWRKANPNYGVSIYPDDLERLAKKAMEVPSATNNFLTKRLNVWVNADTAWMDMRAWDRCSGDIDIDDFAGEECWLGLDLATKIDVAVKTRLFKRDIEGKTNYYVFTEYYVPETAIEEARNSQYSGWAIEGRLVATPGNVIDYDYIKSGLRDDCDRFQVQQIAYDPWQATQLATEMFAEGAPMVEVRANVGNFSEPMKELEALVLQGRLHHGGDPVLTWMVSNVVCHEDNKGNIYPRKERPENKIDGVIGLIMALNRALPKEEVEEPSVYEGLTEDQIKARLGF